jgi:hypothetical protein
MFGRLYMIIGTVSALYRRAQIAALRALAAGPGPRQPRCPIKMTCQAAQGQALYCAVE